MWYAIELSSDADEVKVLFRGTKDGALKVLQKTLRTLLGADFAAGEEIDTHVCAFLGAATPQTRETTWEKVDTHWGENDIQQFFITQSLDEAEM